VCVRAEPLVLVCAPWDCDADFLSPVAVHFLLPNYTLHDGAPWTRLWLIIKMRVGSVKYARKISQLIHIIWQIYCVEKIMLPDDTGIYQSHLFYWPSGDYINSWTHFHFPVCGSRKVLILFVYTKTRVFYLVVLWPWVRARCRIQGGRHWSTSWFCWVICRGHWKTVATLTYILLVTQPIYSAQPSQTHTGAPWLRVLFQPSDWSRSRATYQKLLFWQAKHDSTLKKLFAFRGNVILKKILLFKGLQFREDYFWVIASDSLLSQRTICRGNFKKLLSLMLWSNGKNSIKTIRN
jgi:hypothetical protein